MFVFFRYGPFYFAIAIRTKLKSRGSTHFHKQCSIGWHGIFKDIGQKCMQVLSSQLDPVIAEVKSDWPMTSRDKCN